MKERLRLAALATMVVAWMPLHGNIPGKAELRVEGGTIQIEYIAPALKGRDIEVEIHKPGANPWRLGADSPTTLTTPVALTFGDSELAPGRYVLRAYLDDQDQWWLQAHDSARSVAGKLRLNRSQAETSEENLVIALTGSPAKATVSVQWGRHRLTGDFSVAE